MFILLGVVVVLGLDNSATFWYWNKAGDKEKQITFSSWFWTQLIFSMLVLVLVFFFSPVLSEKIFKETGYSDLFVLAALNLPFSCFTLVFTTWLRVKKNAVGTVLFTLLNTFITIALSIYLVVYLKIGVRGVFISQLVANSLSAVIVIVAIPKNLAIANFSADRIRQMIKYSGPLIPAFISYWILNSAGSYFINHYATKSDVGLYQIGSSCAAVCNIVFWAFLQAWSPFAMSIHQQNEAPKIYSAVFDIYCACGSGLVLIIFLFAPEILTLLTTKEYVNAALVAGILSVNIFIVNLAQITSIGCAITKKNMPYAIGVFLGSGASILFYFLLIPFFGKEGAAISTLLGSLILVSYVTYKAQLLYFIPYHLRKNLAIISLMVIIIIISIFWVI